MRIICVVGARPNFMKIGPLWRLLASRSNRFEPILVHTGQHYDANMNDVFFKELGLPEPRYCLGVGSGTQAEQTAATMTRFEAVVVKEQPDRILVVGDVNSTLACALVAAKLCIPVDHVEAGLRSFDRTMVEEINRIVTDAVSEQLFVSEHSGLQNLLREGKPPDSIHYVGNVMIDSLYLALPQARSLRMAELLGLRPSEYLLVTMHRPSNVDGLESLGEVIALLRACAVRLPVVWPLHPRTKRQLETFGFLELLQRNRITILEPLGYVEFLSLMVEARAVLTDSGGIQEETSALGVPCFTLRDNTERPVTIEVGTNTLVHNQTEVFAVLDQVMRGEYKKGQLPELWDGRAAERIVGILDALTNSR